MALNEERSCPFCFKIMDQYGSHCESCMSGGDVTLRHNEARDTIHGQARMASTRPELERQGLLRDLGEPGVNGRRPADT